MDWSYFSFEVDGIVTDVHDEARARDLLAAGQLLPETLIIIFQDGRQKQVRADSIGQMKPLFGASSTADNDWTFALGGKAPDPVAPPQSKQAETATKPKEPPKSVEPPPNPWIVPAPPTPPAQTAPKEPRALPPQPWWRKTSGVLGMIIALVIAGFFALTLIGGSKPYWATRAATVYDAPNLAAATTMTFERGQPVKGKKADFPGWIKIMDGRYQGRFARIEDFSATQPPLLDISSAGTHRMVFATQALEKAESGAAMVRNLARKEKVKVVGLLYAKDGTPWVELDLPGGTVGYIPAASIGLTAMAKVPEDIEPVVEVKNEVAINQPPKTSPMAAPPAPVPVGGTTPAPPPVIRDRCSQRPRPIEQMQCRHTDLAAYDSLLVETYNRARTANPGQTPLPPAIWRAGTECDYDYACYVGAYRGQIKELERIIEAGTSRPPPATGQGKKPRIKGDPSRWITSDDYPSDAARRGEEGTVAIQLSVGTTGSVTDCRITASSGSSSLDAQTCNLVTRRARFTPATDDAGNIVMGTHQQRITWRLP